MKILNHKLWKCTGCYPLTQSNEKSNYLIYMDNISLFAKKNRAITFIFGKYPWERFEPLILPAMR